MKKFWKKKLIFKALALTLLFGFWLARPLAAVAADLGVVFEKDPLFSLAADGYWLPGDAVSHWAAVTNNSAQAKTVLVETFGEIASYPEDLADVLELTISVGSNDLYGGSLGTKYLSDFYTESELALSILSAGSSVTYDFKVNLDKTVGNDWQGQDTGFDLRIGFKGAEVGGTGAGEDGAAGTAASPTPTLVGIIAGLTTETVVLGEATPAAATEELPGQIAGAGAEKIFPWWWLLLLLPFIYYWWRRRKA